jgi:Flp pilus assembly protein TadG
VVAVVKPLWGRVTAAAARPVRRVRSGGDRGSVELAITIPVVLMLTLGGVQVATWYHARNACQSAARAGVRAGRTLDASAGAAQSAAASYLSQTGGDMVVGGQIAEQLTASTVTVTCTGSAPRIVPLPGFSISVRQSSTGQRERFTTSGGPP